MFLPLIVLIIGELPIARLSLSLALTIALAITLAITLTHAHSTLHHAAVEIILSLHHLEHL